MFIHMNNVNICNKGFFIIVVKNKNSIVLLPACMLGKLEASIFSIILLYFFIFGLGLK